MSYKPKFCCQCGEKIDDLNRKWWESGRFCDFCVTEYGIYDKAQGVLFGITLLFALYGIGSYFQKPEKQISVVSHPTAVSDAKNVSVLPKTVVSAPPEPGIQTPLKSEISKTQTNLPPASKAANLSVGVSETQVEKTYFCGATTKKGTMCSRRVKNGGRCWQHEGQPAQLPQEKLLATAR